MTPIVLHLISVSAKIVLLGGLAWLQLHLLRRAPATSRALVCSMALVAIVVFAAGEVLLTPEWLAFGPVFHFAAAASARDSLSTLRAQSAWQTHWNQWCLFLWLAGAGFMLLRGIAGRAALALVRRRSTPLERFSGLDVRTGQVDTPILTGVLHPAILIPASACRWTAEQRRMVLTHELTHFRQGDCWSNLLAQMVRAVFWFHPVLWMLAARMSREQELACDEAVVAAGHSRHDYGAFLLEAARNLRSRDLFACAMAGSGARSMKQRFANLLDMRPRLLSRRAAATLALFAALTISLAVVRPVWSQDENGAYRVGNGVTPPKVLSKADPQYSEEARKAKISGSVLLKAIVTPEGNADNITVVRGVGYGLDQKAIEAVSTWAFQPGTKDGKPVPVWVTIEVNFRLLDRKP